MYGLFPDVNQHIWVIHRETSKSTITAIDVLDPISFKVMPLKDYIQGPVPFSLGEIQKVVSDSSHQLFITVKGGMVYHFDGHGIKLVIQIQDMAQGFELGIGKDYLITIIHYADSLDVWTKDGQWQSRHPIMKTNDQPSSKKIWESMGSTAQNQQILVGKNPNGFHDSLCLSQCRWVLCHSRLPFGRIWDGSYV
jgi:hypothetical protein